MSQSSTSSTSQPVPVSSTLAQLPSGILFFPGLIGALIVLLLAGLWSYKLIYKITPNNEAFVRTGGLFVKKKSVILYGGCIVLPGFHELTRVPLREISIDVERTGNLAVRTQDYLRANMRATFYVCINADQEDVLIAAARLSKQGRVSTEDIKEALEKRADDAIRAAAKKKSLPEIDSDKLGFADEVLNLIQPDLKKVGLTLNNIAISEIEESDIYDTNNFFDAQGVRLRTETIQRSIQQKREVELSTQVRIEQQELDAEKQSLRIVKEKEEASLGQQLEVESLKSQRQREIQEAKDREAATVQRTKILQDKSVEEEEIRRKLSVQENQIEADIALEERNKQLKVAQTLQKQEAEIAEITRQQTVDSSRLEAQVRVAEAERLSKVAKQEAAIAIANKERERFVSEAERAEAESGVVTATEIEKAEREKRLSLITAEQEAEKRRIADQNVVEIDVFRRRRQAEIARQAAELEADSIRTLAQANRDKALAEAEGKRAIIEAENTLSDSKLSAQVLTTIWPGLVDKLPEIAKALAPQPGILGDTRIFAFPGMNGSNGNGHGNGMGDINKLLLSTSGLSLINTLLDEGKLGKLIGQVSQLVRNNPSQNGGNESHNTPESSAELETQALVKRQTPPAPPPSKSPGQRQPSSSAAKLVEPSQIKSDEGSTPPHRASGAKSDRDREDPRTRHS
ncbi:SPFH domain / Band 7 family protein [Coleofasciculus chthonoplastes PCC 7420]|uniref:SPFH domain / Band 7 family protein n=1 Tax=Coleofasciculus chthonoplastes PCC 7420 TaxID=118168 RepID=B4VQL4_9CYAN|nr:flotillin family protein [Coleofasciculus chthonoplastes]EDX75878.1 SPFH domain / Band 7 family protein [Coleofasciculus chthonoplastes PCC 7420]